MKYYKLNIYTDWQVMYESSFMNTEFYKYGIIHKLNNIEFYKDFPVIPCRLIHKYEDYRNLDWKEEGMLEPPIAAPLLKDIIQRSGKFSLAGGRGIII